MRILMSTPTFLPDVSGESIYIKQLSFGLLKLGHEIKIFTYNNKRITKNNVSQSSLQKILLRADADIIHSHHYGYYPATAGFIAAKMNKIPHVFGPYYHPPIYGKGKKALFFLYHISQGLPILKFSDRVLPHTKYEKEILCKVGADEDNMDILPNIVDTKVFKPKNVERNVVLFAGHLLQTKGPHIALDIAKQMLADRKNLKFVFLGVGPMEGWLKKRAAKIDKTRIIFMKNLPLERLVSLYSSAKVMILPSYYEAFGKTLAESLSCETPVVSTRVGGIPEVVGDGGFLADYGDWTRFKEYMEILLDDDNRRRRLGRSGRKRMKENFDTDVVVNKLETIYKKSMRNN